MANETFTVAGAHGGTIENEKDFHTDAHGVWCGECGNGAGSVYVGKDGAGRDVWRYSCCMRECKNHDARYQGPSY